MSSSRNTIVVLGLLVMISVLVFVLCDEADESSESADVSRSSAQVTWLQDTLAHQSDMIGVLEAQVEQLRSLGEEKDAEIAKLESDVGVPAVMGDCKQISEAWLICQTQLSTALRSYESAAASLEVAESNYDVVLSTLNNLWVQLERVDGRTDDITNSANFTDAERVTIYEWWDQWYSALPR